MDRPLEFASSQNCTFPALIATSCTINKYCRQKLVLRYHPKVELVEAVASHLVVLAVSTRLACSFTPLEHAKARDLVLAVAPPSWSPHSGQTVAHCMHRFRHRAAPLHHPPPVEPYQSPCGLCDISRVTDIITGHLQHRTAVSKRSRVGRLPRGSSQVERQFAQSILINLLIRLACPTLPNVALVLFVLGADRTHAAHTRHVSNINRERGQQ